MVSIATLQRRVPYAVLPVLWLAVHLAVHFGDTSYWLRLLCMRFDLVADDPVSFAEAMEAQTPHSFFEDVGPDTGSGSGSLHRGRDWLSRVMRSIPIVASSRTQYWRSLFDHFRAHHEGVWASSSSSASVPPSGVAQAWHGYQRALRAVLPCFTSLFVHYNRMSLINTLVSYLYSLSTRLGPNQAFSGAHWQPLQDVLAAVTGAFLTNLTFQLTPASLTPSGLCKQPIAALMQVSPALNAFAVAVSTVVAVVQSSLPLLASRAGEPEVRVHDAATRHTESASSDATTTTTTRASSTAMRAVPHGYLSGGEGVAYALSGFRLGRYHETEQLRGAAWQFVAGAPIRTSSTSLSTDHSIIDFIRHRTVGADEVRHGGGQPAAQPRTPSNGAEEEFDVFHSTSSSMELYVLINGGSFATGIVLGAGCRAMPAALQWARTHSALVRAVEDYLWPPPPPALWLPRELEEAVPAHQQYDKVELIRVDVASEAFTCFPPQLLGEPLSATATERADPRLPSDGDDSRPGDQTPPCASATDKESTTVKTDGVSLTLLVPSRCFCPITRSLMHDPVRTQDGFTYDRDAITLWLDRHETSPMTNLPLPAPDLRPDMAVRREVAAAVEAFLQRVGPEYVRS